MNNIEEILSKCDNCKLSECEGCITYSDIEIIKARIKELKEENKRKDMFLQMAKEVIENSIPKQKVKDKIEEVKLSGGGNGKDNVENLARELVIDVLEELLEEGE